jgi:D-apionolactonase
VSVNHWPDTTRVTHGGFTLDLAREAIRNIRFEGVQLIDLLYTAIRPLDWSTLKADEYSADVQIIGNDCVITVNEVFAVALSAQAKITISNNNTFSVDYELKGLTEYQVSRWGVCFCLNTADWMRSSVVSSGNTYSLAQDISPQRVVDGVIQGLFPASNEMHFLAPDKRNLKVVSTGKVLEAEDQRNWTDNTYKIYSGSLSEPFPFLTSPGSIWKQSVNFEVGVPESVTTDATKILVKEIEALPSIGLQFNHDSLLTPDDLEKAFILLEIDHLRINEETLTSQKIATTAANGLILEAALLSSNKGDALKAEVLQLSERVPAGSRLLVQREGRQVVDAADLPKNSSLNSYIPGSDAFLVDLQSDQYNFGNSVSYSMAPTVHSFDTETIFKTLFTQQESINFAQKFIAPQVFISPITFSMRGNPHSGHSRDQRLVYAEPEMALHIRTIEGAAWTLGSIHSLASAGAFSGSWHELFGEYGVIYSESGSIKFTPTFHAIAALGAHHAHQITIATSFDNSWVAFENRETKTILVASLRPWSLEITAKVLAGYKSMQSLRGEDCEKASQILDWWSFAEATPISADFPLTLTPFEIALIRG